MAVIVLPTRTDVPHYEFEIDLDLRTYRFEFRWNERAGAWFLSLRDGAGVRLLDGRRVVVNFPLLARFIDPRLPPGDLYAVDTAGNGGDPGLDELGGRVRLLYYPVAEIPATLKR